MSADYATSRVRACDADRQRAVDVLARHLAEGRLTISEYDTRVGKAYAVVYCDEFDELFADLTPVGATAPDRGFPFDAPQANAWENFQASPTGHALRSGQWGQAFRQGQNTFRKSDLRRTLHGRLTGPQRLHPIVTVLLVIVALAAITTLVSVVLPIALVAWVAYLIFGPSRGSAGGARARRGQ